MLVQIKTQVGQCKNVGRWFWQLCFGFISDELKMVKPLECTDDVRLFISLFSAQQQRSLATTEPSRASFLVRPWINMTMLTSWHFLPNWANFALNLYNCDEMALHWYTQCEILANLFFEITDSQYTTKAFGGDTQVSGCEKREVHLLPSSRQSTSIHFSGNFSI